MDGKISFDSFKEIDLRVAEVLEVKEHPDADRLYVIQIRVGEEKKQIVAGIRGRYSREELIGKKVIVVNNLETAVIRGEESNGMILAAGGTDGPIVLIPESDVEAGAKVK
ncbi:MAG: methionine--tRNA ligase subunit beta [Candidatus Omnitrophota bacterium]